MQFTNLHQYLQENNDAALLEFIQSNDKKEVFNYIASQVTNKREITSFFNCFFKNPTVFPLFVDFINEYSPLALEQGNIVFFEGLDDKIEKETSAEYQRIQELLQSKALDLLVSTDANVSPWITLLLKYNITNASFAYTKNPLDSAQLAFTRLLISKAFTDKLSFAKMYNELIKNKLPIKFSVRQKESIAQCVQVALGFDAVTNINYRYQTERLKSEEDPNFPVDFSLMHDACSIYLKHHARIPSEYLSAALRNNKQDLITLIFSKESLYSSIATDEIQNFFKTLIEQSPDAMLPFTSTLFDSALHVFYQVIKPARRALLTKTLDQDITSIIERYLEPDFSKDIPGKRALTPERLALLHGSDLTAFTTFTTCKLTPPLSINYLQLGQIKDALEHIACSVTDSTMLSAFFDYYFANENRFPALNPYLVEFAGNLACEHGNSTFFEIAYRYAINKQALKASLTHYFTSFFGKDYAYASVWIQLCKKFEIEIQDIPSPPLLTADTIVEYSVTHAVKNDNDFAALYKKITDNTLPFHLTARQIETVKQNITWALYLPASLDCLKYSRFPSSHPTYDTHAIAQFRFYLLYNVPISTIFLNVALKTETYDLVKSTLEKQIFDSDLGIDRLLELLVVFAKKTYPVGLFTSAFNVIKALNPANNPSIRDALSQQLDPGAASIVEEYLDLDWVNIRSSVLNVNPALQETLQSGRSKLPGQPKAALEHIACKVTDPKAITEFFDSYFSNQNLLPSLDNYLEYASNLACEHQNREFFLVLHSKIPKNKLLRHALASNIIHLFVSTFVDYDDALSWIKLLVQYEVKYSDIPIPAVTKSNESLYNLFLHALNNGRCYSEFEKEWGESSAHTEKRIRALIPAALFFRALGNSKLHEGRKYSIVCGNYTSGMNEECEYLLNYNVLIPINYIHAAIHDKKDEMITAIFENNSYDITVAEMEELFIFAFGSNLVTFHAVYNGLTRFMERNNKDPQHEITHLLYKILAGNTYKYNLERVQEICSSLKSKYNDDTTIQAGLKKLMPSLFIPIEKSSPVQGTPTPVIPIVSTVLKHPEDEVKSTPVPMESPVIQPKASVSLATEIPSPQIIKTEVNSISVPIELPADQPRIVVGLLTETPSPQTTKPEEVKEGLSTGTATDYLSDEINSSGFLMKFLTHPATLPVFLIIVGAVGLTLGGVGLLGISTGLSVLASQIAVGSGTAVTVTGTAVGLYNLGDQRESSCFLLRVLAHPATLPVFLIIAGAISLTFGGVGLAGIATGLAMLSSKIVVGASVAPIVTGAAFGICRFFGAPKQDGKEDPTPYCDSGGTALTPG